MLLYSFSNTGEDRWSDSQFAAKGTELKKTILFLLCLSIVYDYLLVCESQMTVM